MKCIEYKSDSQNLNIKNLVPVFQNLLLDRVIF